MRKLIFVLMALIALLPKPVAAANMSVTGDAEAKIETDGKARYMVTRSRTFDLTQTAYLENVRTVVVEAEIVHRRRLSEDLANNGDETGTVTLTVYPINSSGEFDPPLATRKLPGDAIDIEGSGGIKVTSYGCCVESNTETQLSLNTLKTKFVKSSSVPLLTYTRLGKPSAVSRTASVYLAMTPADQDVLGSDTSSVAMITWASDEQPLQRVVVHLKNGKPREAVLEWESTIGWKTGRGPLESHTVFDPAKPTKPVFVWKIGEGKAIELPLVGDRFDLATAKTPKGVTLEQLEK
jgi:hypothetical protein